MRLGFAKVSKQMQKRKAFGLYVAYDETPAERVTLWGSHETRRQTMALVSRVRSLPSSRRKNGDETVFGEQSSDLDPADYCSRIHAAIRHLRKSDLGVVASRVDTTGTLKPRATEIVVRQVKRPTALSQLRRLQHALRFKSGYKFEKVYFGLSPKAWDCLAIGFKIAGSKGKFRGFTKVDEPSGHLLLRPMLNADLLALILPHAIAAAPKRGRPSVSHRDRAVAELLKIFVELTGRRYSGAKRGGFDEPKGDGADFVRELERIFRINLMPDGSTHAIERALRIMSEPD